MLGSSDKFINQTLSEIVLLNIIINYLTNIDVKIQNSNQKKQ